MKNDLESTLEKGGVHCILLCFSFFNLLAGHSVAGGVDWVMPVDYFDGVSDVGGYVDYWETVGSVDCGNGLKLPIFINFRSNNVATSPYLGQGWTLPLLESHMVQTGLNSFLMVQPDGTRNFFTRDKPEDTELKDPAGWKAGINAIRSQHWVPRIEV